MQTNPQKLSTAGHTKRLVCDGLVRPSSVPAGWKCRIEIEDDRWLIYAVNPFGEAKFIQDGRDDASEAIAKAIAHAQNEVRWDRERRADKREIYRMSERRPEGEWWWMYDAHMGYWKRWQPGWGYDNGWTHWSPASASAPSYPPGPNSRS